MKNESVTGALGNTLRAGALLAVFALAGGSLLALTYSGTRERIAENERAFTLRSLNEIVDTHRYDNDLFTDVVLVTDRDLLGSKDPVSVYRARKNGQAVAAIIASQAPDGYNGTIKLLVGVNVDGGLAGVRITGHRETPGLGDGIELERSNWVLDFAGHGLGRPAIEGWQVKRDGGDFDQFTGATITPRAVVRAVKNTLLYFDAHKNDLFSPPSQEVEN
ncbi:MAG: electron transport complex subunit RsxG [Gammaproteobacteria bacterium]|nr:electron transport complex subunit RsxG [Gammaproteobacteria bacterium]